MDPDESCDFAGLERKYLEVELGKYKRLSSYWRRKFYQLEKDSATESAHGSCGFRPGSSEATIENRVRNAAAEVKEILSAHPQGKEQADIVGRVIEISIPPHAPTCVKPLP